MPRALRASGDPSQSVWRGAGPDPVEAIVSVTRIGNRIEARRAARRRRLAPPPAEQRPDDRAADRANPRQAGKPRAAPKAHDQSLGLVVQMMGGGEKSGADLADPLRQQRVAPRPSGGLDVRRLGHPGAQRRMRDSERAANAGDERSLGGAFGAQAMVDGCRVDTARKSGVGEQQQGEAVRPARHGEAEPFRRAAGQRFEVGAETGNLLFHEAYPSLLAPGRKSLMLCAGREDVAADAQGGRRSFVGRSHWRRHSGRRVLTVAGEAQAFQEADSDSGPKADGAGGPRPDRRDRRRSNRPRRLWPPA